MTARLLLVALAGCYSFPTMGRAHVVDRGHVEVWGAPEALVVATGGGGGQEGGASVRPLVEAGVRYGATDRIELDARVGTFGIGLGSRLQLWRAQRFELLAAPGLAFTLPNKPALELPVVAGVNVRDRDQIVVSARVVYQQRWGGVTSPLHFAYIGGSLGYAWQLTEHVALMPEVALLTQLWAQPGFTSELPDGVGIQAGIGVLWDH